MGCLGFPNTSVCPSPKKKSSNICLTQKLLDGLYLSRKEFACLGVFILVSHQSIIKYSFDAVLISMEKRRVETGFGDVLLDLVLY